MIISSPQTMEITKQAFDAARQGDFDTLKTLIRFNFNLEACDENGNSVLHAAVLGNQLDIVKFLVEAGGMDPTWSNHEMITPYKLAHEMQLSEIESFFEKVCGFKYEEAYCNPVRRGLYPDPSIVRVGEDYYMVNSTFVFFPCIPISHSKDLVNWELIGHVIVDEEWAEEHLGPLEGGRGFWAPDISYHNGRFYVTATLRLNDDAPCIQTQMVTSSERPEGPYDTPVIHNFRGIDPSIFTDDDGKRYMLLNRGAQIMEISEDGKEIISDQQLIWYGSNKYAPEGPHILKKDGYYYCFLAEGGTGRGHMITVARSKNLYGPYEDCPYNPIMHQKHSASIIQCCGHGKPVQVPDGRWFIVYLCSRYIDERWGMLGRETCMDEIVWTPDGWPIINRGKGPSYMNKKPYVEQSLNHQTQSSQSLQEPWMAPRSLHADRIQIDAQKVQITGDGFDLCNRDNRSIVVKRQPDFKFTAEFEMEMPKEPLTGDAGMVLYYDENTYIKFGISRDKVIVSEYIDDRYVRTVEKAFGEDAKDNVSTTDSVIANASVASVPATATYRLKIETDKLRRTFILDDEEIASFDDVTCICSEGFSKGRRFTGAMYGIYVYGKETITFHELEVK